MKKHIIDELKGTGMSGSEAERAFDDIVAAMGRVVRRGDRVRIPGIGTLYRKTRAETVRRNPRTGEKMTIASYDVVALRNAEKL